MVARAEKALNRGPFLFFALPYRPFLLPLMLLLCGALSVPERVFAENKAGVNTPNTTNAVVTTGESSTNNDANLADVLKLTDIAFQSYGRKFSLIAWIFGTGSALLLLLVGLLGAFGIREVRDIVKPLKREHDDIISDLRKERAEHANLIQETKQAHASITSLIYCHFAFVSTEKAQNLPEEKRKNALQRAKVHLEKVLEEIKPHNDLVLGWAHMQYSFILRRLHNTERALQFLEDAISNGVKTAGNYYNAVCYLATTDKEKAKRYLDEAIKKDFFFFINALSDNDLEEIMRDYMPPQRLGEGQQDHVASDGTAVR